MHQSNTERILNSTQSQETSRVLSNRNRGRVSVQNIILTRTSSTPNIKLSAKPEFHFESRNSSASKVNTPSPDVKSFTPSLLKGTNASKTLIDFKISIDQGYRRRKPKPEMPLLSMNSSRILQKDPLLSNSRNTVLLPSDSNRFPVDSGLFQLETQPVSSPNSSKMKAFNKKMKLLFHYRHDLRNGKLLENSAHKQHLLKLVTQFESIMNSYLDNVLILSEKEFKVAETTLEVELTVYSVFKNLLQELNVQHTENQKLKGDIFKSEGEIKALKKELFEKNKHDGEVEGVLKRVNEIVKRGETQSNAISVERNRMDLEKKLINDEIEHFKSTISSAEKQIHQLREERGQLQLRVKVLDKERDALQVKVSKYEVVAANNMNKMVALIKEYDVQRDKLANVEQIISNAEYDRDRALETANMYRERGLMQREDCEGVIGEFARYREEVIKMRDKMLMNEVKISQQLLKKKDERDEIRKDLEFTMTMQDAFLKEHVPMFSDQPVNELLKAEETESGLDIKIFQVKKAPFSALFEDTEEYKSRVEGRKFGQAFIATIRSIFDSKYNEFLLYGDDMHKISRFPDFVFGWIGKFCLDDKSRCVRELTFQDPEPDAVRRTFYSMLEDSKCLKLWDAITFKEFLSESMAPDELMFYLHTRMLMFNGPQLDRLSAKFNYKDLILFEKVAELVDHVLGDYVSVQEIEFLKTGLRGRVLHKNKKNLMDASLALRVILEAYRKIKELRFHKLWNIIKGQTNIGNNAKNFSISFRGLSNVINTLNPNYSETELAEIYRKAWALGKGRVSQYSLLATLNDTGYLIKFMKMKPWTPLPSLLTNSQFDPKFQCSQLCERLLSKFHESNTVLENFHHFLRGFGIEALTIQIGEYEKLFKNKFQVDVGVLNGQNVIAFGLNYWSLIMKVSHAEISIRSYRNQSSTDADQIGVQLEAMLDAFKDYNRFKREDAIVTLQKSSWIKKFQKFAKKKILVWNKLLNYVLRDGAKTNEGQGDKRKSVLRPIEEEM